MRWIVLLVCMFGITGCVVDQHADLNTQADQQAQFDSDIHGMVLGRNAPGGLPD